jgi:hypothetical protein
MCADNAGESIRRGLRIRLSRDLCGIGWRDLSTVYLCEQLSSTQHSSG